MMEVEGRVAVLRKSDGFPSEKLFVLPDYVTAELARHALIRDLYVTDIGFFPRAEHHYRERPEGCDTHILMYCVSGSGFVQIGQKRSLRMKSHSLIVIPAGTPHRYGAYDGDPWSIYWFHLQGEQAEAILGAFGLSAVPMEIPFPVYLKFTELFDQIYTTLLEKTHSTVHHIQVSQTVRYLLGTLGTATQAATQKEKRGNQYLETAIQYMKEHIDQSLTLDELSAVVGISKPHLIELFKQGAGYPPIDYFLRLKVQRASQLLDLTLLPVKEIGAMIGIPDPYYFSRVFKKITGYSPSAYRSILKG